MSTPTKIRTQARRAGIVLAPRGEPLFARDIPAMLAIRSTPSDPGHIESEQHRREIAAAQLSDVRADWYDIERSEQGEAIAAWLDAHPEIIVGARVPS